MKKFEEEVKGKAATMATQPGCSMTRKVWYKADDIHELSEGWVSPEDYQNTVASNKAYEKSNLVLSKENAKFVVENIELEKQIIELKSQLAKQQPEIPEVSQFVADWYEKRKDHLEYHIWMYIRRWNDHEKDDFYNFMNGAHSTPIETLINMKNGYTVAKEKRFYLKNKLTGLNLVEEKTFSLTGKHVGERFREFEMQYIPTDEQEARLYKNTFTQQEIESMETRSYEQIEVEE